MELPNNEQGETRQVDANRPPTAGTDDATSELLQQLLDDNPKAWTQLVAEYSSLLVRVANRTFAAYGFKPVTHDAEDVVSVVWSNVLANDRRIVRRCLENGRWLPTLYTLARNRAVDVMRATKMTTLPLDESQLPEPEIDKTSDEPDVSLEQLQTAMLTLNQREQTFINLFFLQSKKYHEIAALTGVAQNSIGPTLWRALTKLRGKLVPKQ